jgi:homocitrate synthase NifV
MHNDFGQATANTLAGIKAGAGLFSGTFTGIGERAGNTPLEEVIMALKYQYGKSLPLRYEQLGELCDLVESYSGVYLQVNRPISGKNAFAHESGTHVDGVLKYPGNYETFDPCEIGRERRFLFGKHSGKNGLRHFFPGLSEEEYTKLLARIKSMSEQRGRAFLEEEVRRMLNE